MTFTSVIASLEILGSIPCILYLVEFQKGQLKVKILIDSSSKINGIIPVYATKLGFITQKTNVGASKIDDSLLETYNIVLPKFSLQNSLRKIRFFKKTFLLANTNMEMVLRILFLAPSNINCQFITEELTCKSYIIVEILPSTSRVELINKREFAKAALNKSSETFVIYISVLETMTIYLSRAAQIAILQWDKALTEIPAKYSDYVNVFSSDLAIELSKNIEINEHTIKLINNE